MAVEKAKIQMAKLKLKQMLSWSDRIGSDEIVEINEVIKLLGDVEIFSKKDMEKCFIAGGKLALNIEKPSFEETINKILEDDNSN